MRSQSRYQERKRAYCVSFLKQGDGVWDDCICSELLWYAVLYEHVLRLVCVCLLVDFLRELGGIHICVPVLEDESLVPRTEYG